MKRIHQFTIATVLLFAGATRAPAQVQTLTAPGAPFTEGSSRTLTFTFVDSNNLPFTPDEVICWVSTDEEGSQGTLLYQCPPIAPVPGPMMEVTAPPQAQRIANNARDIERHIVTLMFRKDDWWGTEWGEFEVQNVPDIVVGSGDGGVTWAPSPVPTP